MPITTAAEYRRRREVEEVECPSGDVFRICKPDLASFLELAGELPIPALPDADSTSASDPERERYNQQCGERMLLEGVVSPKIVNDFDAAGQPLLPPPDVNTLHLSELDRMDVITLLRRISIKMGLNQETAQQAQAFRADEERPVDTGAGPGIPPATI